MAMLLRRWSLPQGTALTAHGLAWAAFLWLLFWPHFYEGVSETAVAPGANAREPARFTASLLEVNGLRVLPILLVPVALTGLSLAVSVSSFRSTRRRPERLVLWSSALLLVLFCALGAFSIGLFYLPAALLSVTAAAVHRGTARQM